MNLLLLVLALVLFIVGFISGIIFTYLYSIELHKIPDKLNKKKESSKIETDKQKEEWNVVVPLTDIREEKFRENIEDQDNWDN